MVLLPFDHSIFLKSMKKYNNAYNIWGIDMGGTKIEGAILQSSDEPTVLFRERVPTEAHKGYKHILEQVEKLIYRMEAAAGYRPDSIGMATPGTLIPSTGIMKNCNAVALNGQLVQKDLEAKLNLRVILANDANCFALAETKLGVVKQRYPYAKVVFGVILGTGVGGGLVVNGQIINGFHGIGGEWGHNLLTGYQGGTCFCGKTGDNESIFSGPALEKYYEQQTGYKKSMKDIVKLARLGQDKAAVVTIDRLTQGFALAISVVINIIDPEVIVIGGGLGQIEEIYSDGVPAISQYVFNHSFSAPVVRPNLGDSAGVFGAAFLNVTN